MTLTIPPNPLLTKRAQSLIHSRANVKGDRAQDKKTTLYSNEFEERLETRLARIESQLNETPMRKVGRLGRDVFIGAFFLFAGYEYSEARSEAQAQVATIPTVKTQMVCVADTPIRSP